MKKALISSARHAATTLAGALTMLQLPLIPDVDFAKQCIAAVIAAGFSGVIRFLTLVGESPTESV